MRTTDTIAVNAMQYAAQCLAMGKALGFNADILRLAFAELCSASSGQPVPAGNAYPVTVDYTRTLADMIAAGNYGYKNSNITAKNFPVTGEGKQGVVLELVHLNHSATTDEALSYLEAHGLRPATLPELLAFGEKYPDVQREFPVVALGSSWVSPRGNRIVAYLWDDFGERSLDLYWCECEWLDDDRFLAVRK